MRSSAWYRNKLYKYFTVYFGQYEDTAEFLPDPSDNQWVFDIPELDLRVKLTCYDNGKIDERRYVKSGGLV